MNYHIDKYIAKNLIPFSINLISTNNKKQFTFIPQFSQITEKNYSQFINNTNTNKMNGLALRLGTIVDNDYYVILLDIDNKEDNEEMKNGMTKWKELIQNKNIVTMTQKTGNNGLHYLFKINKKQYETLPATITGLNIDGVKYSIDFKNKNQFVIVEPTKYGDKTYKWINIDEKIEIIPEWIYEMLCNNKKKTEYIKNKKNGDYDNKQCEYIDLEKLKKYINYLNKERSEIYDKWINVGLCLYNLNCHSYDIWIEFSKLSKKFNQDESDEKWKSFSLTIRIDVKKQMAILINWINEDNPDNDIQNILTTQEVMNNNGINKNNKPFEIAKICRCEYYNEVHVEGDECYFNKGQHNKNSTIARIDPKKSIITCSDYICAGEVHKKDIIMTQQQQNNMFSLTQINNFNNFVITNIYNEINDYYLKESNIFDNKEINDLIFQCVNDGAAIYFSELFRAKYKNKILLNKKKWFIYNDNNGNWRELENIRLFITEELKPYFIKLKEHYEENQQAIKKINEIIKQLSESKKKTDIVFELGHNYDSKNQFIFNENKNLISFKNGVYDLEKMIFRTKTPEDRITYSTNYDYCDKYSYRHKNLLNFLDKINTNKNNYTYMLKYFSYCLGQRNEKFITCLTCIIENTKNKFIELLLATFGDYCVVDNNTENINIHETNNKRLIIINNNEMKKLDKVCYNNINNGEINILISCENIIKIDNNKIINKDKFRLLNISNNNIEIKTKMNEFKEDFMLLLIENYKIYKAENKLKPSLKNIKWNDNKVDIYERFIKDNIVKSNEHIFTQTIYKHFKLWFENTISSIEPVPTTSKLNQELRKHYSLVKISKNGMIRLGIKNINLIKKE